MLGELIFEEKGTTSGIRVLSSEGGEVEVEVNLKTEGKILGVEETSMWTYTSKTRADGSIYGEGTGFMTTQDGATIDMHAQGAAKATSDGSAAYRGALYFQTTAEKYAHLNSIAGVVEYDVDAQGNTVGKIWEWK